MSLERYRQKRKFNKTSEPKGIENPSGQGNLCFVVQKHQASHLHYDFRLEMDGVLKSWAVPKGVPEKSDEKRLAIMVEDHPLEYGSFEGEIPKGEYGAGMVEIIDKGKYEVAEATDKALKFDLHGKKYKGRYVLFNFKDKNWFLFKIKA